MTKSIEREDHPVRDVAIILLLSAIILLPSMLTRDLWNPDEPRYMAVGWGMAETGNYLVPHLSGYVYPDKPPLFFWLAAFFYKIGFGLNSGRIVAALASTGTVLVTYFLARRHLGGKSGLTAALVTLSASLFLLTSKTGVIDPLVTFLMVATISCGLRAMSANSVSRRRWWLAAYMLTGLAALTKGPVGIVVPLVVLGVYAYAMRGKVRVRGWVHVAGIFLMLNIVAWWLVPALVSGGGEYAENILFSQTARRLVKSDSHRAPFYHYLMLLPGVLFPWSLLLAPAGWSAWKAWRRDREPAAILGLTWFLGIFIFFSAVSGKRAGYILPIAPAVGLLIARYFSKELIWPKLHRRLAGTTVAIFVIAAIVMMAGITAAGPVSAIFYPDDASLRDEITFFTQGAAFLFTVPLVLAIGIAIYCVRKGLDRFPNLTASLLGLMVISSLTMDSLYLPRLNNFKSGRIFAEAAKPYLDQSDDIYFYKSDFSGVYNLYTGRVAVPIVRRGMLGELFASEKRIAVIGNEKDIRLEIGEDAYAEMKMAESRVGHRTMAVITNWKGPEDPEQAGQRAQSSR